MTQCVLVVGYGSIGRRHTAVVKQRHPDSRIVILRREATGEAPADCEFVTSLDDALAHQPATAIVCSPAPFHAETTIPLLNNGIPVLLEKPLAADLDSARAIETAAQISGTPVLLGYNLRYLPALTALKTELDSGRLGRIYRVNAEVGQYLPSWRPNQEYQSTVSANASLGGGVLLELSHEFDYLSYLFGQPQAVTASIAKRSNLEIDVEDCVSLLMEIENSSHEFTINLNMDLLKRNTTRTCEIVAESGTLSLDFVSATLTFRDHDHSRILHNSEIARVDSYAIEHAHFEDVIAGRATAEVSVTEGIKTLELIEAARQSARQRKWISLSGENNG